MVSFDHSNSSRSTQVGIILLWERKAQSHSSVSTLTLT